MSNRARPVWPYVCILVALFTLSVMAPERWEEASRNARLSAPIDSPPKANHAGRQSGTSRDTYETRDRRPVEYAERLDGPPQIDEPASGVWSIDGPETCDWEPPRPTAAQEVDVAGVHEPVTNADDLSSDQTDTTLQVDAGTTAPSLPATEICSTPDSARAVDQEPRLADHPAEDDESDWELETHTEGEAASADANTESSAESPAAAPPVTGGSDGSADAEKRAIIASDQPGASGWTPPHDLLEQLESLRSEPETGAWATSTLTLLDEITAAGGPRTVGGGSRLTRLRELAAQSTSLADRIPERYVSRRLRVAGYGLARRLTIWNALTEVASAMQSNQEPVVAADRAGRNTQLLACLDEVDELTSSAPAGAGWRKYLLIDQLQTLANRQVACGDDEARELARDVLRRLNPRRMTPRQQQFTEREPVVALAAELRRWAAEEVDLDRIQANLEEYELTGRPSVGRQVLADTRLLSFSPEPAALELAKTIEANYRVANLRMSISDDLLQKMMPKQDPRHQYIRQVIMGMEARGQTTTTSNIKIEFVPDARRLRFVMQVTGMIHAQATSEKGLIKVHSRADSDYVVLKNFEFTLDGLQAEPAQADAHTRARLRGVDTPLEPVPLLGSVLEGYVRDRYRSSKRAAERELRRKIMAKVVEQVEKETDTQIVDANDRLKKNLLDPLRGLDLEPTVAALQTTKDRMTIRLRLAGEDQLAANTPRPRAPTDSLASIQLHESALNNILAKLELDGREFSQAELHRWVASKLNRPLEQVDDNLREDVFLKFAPRDAVRARALEGRIELTLSLAELRAEGSRYRNFVVRVYYRPDEASTSGELMRDGVVQLIGKRLGPKAQIALRGVFSKTFSKERRFRLLPPRFSKDEQLADIGITQMVIQDGWLGMGIGTVPRQAAKPIQLRR
jgi:hypothetical protein